MSHDTVISTSGLTKFYGAFKAVDSVSLNLTQGEIYGFLGLNGAGKTTTIRMLLGMIRPSAGDVFVCGQRIVPGGRGPWDKIGYLVELPYSYPELTVTENLIAASRLRGITGTIAARRIIERLHLGPYEHVKTRNLSLGNNQRLGLAKALIHEPEVLVLDEPSNGLDPAGIVEIRDLLRSLSHGGPDRGRGVTVFISSHNLDEISRLATRIGIIHEGVLIREIDTNSLVSQLETSLLIDVHDGTGAAAFLAGRGFSVERSGDGTLRIRDPKAFDKPEEVNDALVRAGFPPRRLVPVKEDLESYFLKVTGGSA